MTYADLAPPGSDALARQLAAHDCNCPDYREACEHKPCPRREAIKTENLRKLEQSRFNGHG